MYPPCNAKCSTFSRVCSCRQSCKVSSKFCTSSKVSHASLVSEAKALEKLLYWNKVKKTSTTSITAKVIRIVATPLLFILVVWCRILK